MEAFSRREETSWVEVGTSLAGSHGAELAGCYSRSQGGWAASVKVGVVVEGVFEEGLQAPPWLSVLGQPFYLVLRLSPASWHRGRGVWAEAASGRR